MVDMVVGLRLKFQAFEMDNSIFGCILKGVFHKTLLCASSAASHQSHRANVYYNNSNSTHICKYGCVHDLNVGRIMN